MYEVKIEKLDHFGNGLARIDGKIVFIPKTLPEDIVLIEITKDNKKFLLGKVIKYINKVPRNSTCPYSEICGGCHLIDMEYAKQIEFKKNKVQELLDKAKLDVQVQDIITGNNYNYRNKITLHVKNKKLGLYKEGTHNLVEIDKCVITDKEINNLIVKLKDLVKKNDIKDIMIRNHNGLLLSINGKVSKEVLLKEFICCQTIYLNDHLIKGNGVEQILLDKKFRISKNSFFQVNVEVCSKIFNKVREYIKDKNYKRVLDLYCGTGVIGIIVSDLVKEVTGIEVVESAITDANYNKELNKVSNINFICDKVENRIDEFKDIDLIIVDPPRSGLDNKSVKSIIDIAPKDIIYISCDPATLVRDLKELSNNYNIDEFFVADMFPNTYHVESIAYLSKK